MTAKPQTEILRLLSHDNYVIMDAVNSIGKTIDELSTPVFSLQLHHPRPSHPSPHPIPQSHPPNPSESLLEPLQQCNHISLEAIVRKLEMYIPVWQQMDYQDNYIDIQHDFYHSQDTRVVLQEGDTMRPDPQLFSSHMVEIDTTELSPKGTFPHISRHILKCGRDIYSVISHRTRKFSHVEYEL
jgi:hypothetical protein